MKKFLMALVVLAIASGPALAGPNENGQLMVHNTGVAWSTDPFPTVQPACLEIVNTVEMAGTPAAQSVPVVWKVYAVFPLANSPRLMTVGWGINFNPVADGGVVIEQNGPAGPGVFNIVSAGWPPALGSTAGDVGMSFTDSTRISHVTECWWFSGYAYAGSLGEPQMFSVVPNIFSINQIFGDDAFPSNADPITGYGRLGFGQPGYTYCPTGIVTGACCFTTGVCEMLSAVDCQTAGGSFLGGDCTPVLCPVIKYGACCVGTACNVVTAAACTNAGGNYFGDDTTCEPTPCVIPVETKSWGQIKSSYR